MARRTASPIEEWGPQAPAPIAAVAERRAPRAPLCTMRECMPMRACGTSQVGHAHNVKGETSECHGCYGIPTDPGDSSRRSYPRTLGPRSLASTALHCAHLLLRPPMLCHVLCDTWCVRGCVRARARGREGARVRAQGPAGVSGMRCAGVTPSCPRRQKASRFLLRLAGT